MPSSLKQFISRKLKENVPLSDIKQELKERGYAVDEISKAVREVISGGRVPAHFIQIGILVVGVVIAVGIGVYLSTNTRTVASYQQLCAGYTQPSGGISCEDAIKFALSKYSGDVSSVKSDFTRKFDSSTGDPLKTEWAGWLVLIRLSQPIKSGDANYHTIGLIVDNAGFAVHQYIGE